MNSSSVARPPHPEIRRTGRWTLLAARLCAAAGLWLTLAWPAAQAAKSTPPPPLYSYYAVGSVGQPVGTVAPRIALRTPAKPSYVLMGGGPDVDEAFRWMIQRAGITPATGGRLVVIRATGDGAYNPYIYYCNKKGSTACTEFTDGWVGGAALGLTSVETLVIPSMAAANDPTVNAIVANANAVWIAGGDQSHYIKYWKGQALEGTLNRLMTANVPIGGTSAGLAVLGGFDYSALYLSATSEGALADPYHPDITFDPSPLSTTGGFIAPPAFAGTIMDSHLDSRDRMGRLITFVSRLIKPGRSAGAAFGCPGGVLANSTARGIGIGVEAALLVEGAPSGPGFKARRVTNISTRSESAVYFVNVTLGPTQCVAGRPLETPSSSVQIFKLADSDTEIELDTLAPLNVYKSVYATGGQILPFDPY